MAIAKPSRSVCASRRPIGVVIAGGEFVVGVAVVVRDLEVVLADLAGEAELIFGSLVADDGNEAALGVGGVVIDGGDGRGEAVVGARAGEAGVPGGLGGVIAERELGFAGVEVAAGDGELGIAIALEAAAGRRR